MDAMIQRLIQRSYPLISGGMSSDLHKKVTICSSPRTMSESYSPLVTHVHLEELGGLATRGIETCSTAACAHAIYNDLKTSLGH